MPTIACEPEVVTIGVLDGELTPEQGAVLLRQDKEKASAYLLNRLQTTLPDGRSNDPRPIIQSISPFPHVVHAVTPARPKQADQREPFPEGLTSVPGLLLELTWRVCGLVPTFSVIYTKNLPLVMNFLEAKFRNEVHDLSFEDLGICAKKSSSWPTQPLVRKAQARKLVPIADHLLQNPSEVNRDIVEVKRRVSEYSFNPDLNEVLDKVETELAAGGDQFDQAASLKHLRTFFEKLHEQVGQTLQARKPDTVDNTPLGSFGQAIDYLCRKSVVKDKVRDLSKSIYGVLSNEGVHALKTEREYVRLCRNMIAEYTLVLFAELDRRIRV